MKTALLLFCLLGATAAFGQSVGGGALSANPQILEFPSHPSRAIQHSMGSTEDVREQSDSVFARGERPLWEVAPKHTEVPLGDTARMLKKQHETAKKSEVIWVN